MPTSYVPHSLYDNKASTCLGKLCLISKYEKWYPSAVDNNKDGDRRKVSINLPVGWKIFKKFLKYFCCTQNMCKSITKLTTSSKQHLIPDRWPFRVWPLASGAVGVTRGTIAWPCMTTTFGIWNNLLTTIDKSPDAFHLLMLLSLTACRWTCPYRGRPPSEYGIH